MFLRTFQAGEVWQLRGLRGELLAMVGLVKVRGSRSQLAFQLPDSVRISPADLCVGDLRLNGAVLPAEVAKAVQPAA